jgi:hypothetical protein
MYIQKMLLLIIYVYMHSFFAEKKLEAWNGPHPVNK